VKLTEIHIVFHLISHVFGHSIEDISGLNYSIKNTPQNFWNSLPNLAPQLNFAENWKNEN
jgi:hypothetical protein